MLRDSTCSDEHIIELIGQKGLRKPPKVRFEDGGGNVNEFGLVIKVGEASLIDR